MMRRFRGTPGDAVTLPVDPILARARSENRAVLSEKENSQTGTREGFIYIISNPAWPEWVKVGRALDYEDRTNGYQTGCPFRDYVCHFSAYFADRASAEARVHEVLMWDSERRNREWFHVTVEKAISAIQTVQQEQHSVGNQDSLRTPAPAPTDGE